MRDARIAKHWPDRRKVKQRAQNPSARQRRLKENIEAGMSLKQSMLDAGYAATTASTGTQGISRTSWAYMGNQGQLVKIGASLTSQQIEHLVLGRLATNVEKGQDKGVQSSFRLGQYKSVNMFAQESQAGAIVVNLQVNNGTEVPVEQDPQEKK